MSKVKDLTGEKFGNLLVVERAESKVQANGRKRTMWKCICDCGKTTVQESSHLIQGDVISCGCIKNKKSADRCRERKGKIFENVRVNCIGEKNGKLTVIGEGPYLENERHRTLVCKCECGNEVIIRLCHRKKIFSCGCDTRSKGERIIRDYLTQNNVDFKEQFTFPDLRFKNCLRFDFQIITKDSFCLIEFQGIQHFLITRKNPLFGEQQRDITDKMKKDYCKDNNIKLYEIRYDDDIIAKLKEILSNMSIPCQAKETSKV